MEKELSYKELLWDVCLDWCKTSRSHKQLHPMSYHGGVDGEHMLLLRHMSQCRFAPQVKKCDLHALDHGDVRTRLHGTGDDITDMEEATEKP
eukprot:1153066-Pelagomonas_calceolata.AAC.1